MFSNLMFLGESLILVGGTVHTFVEGTETAPLEILISDGRIAAVGVGLERPQDCREVDVTGMHLVPGLIDGMAYHDREHDPLYTSSGVGFLVDHGNDLGRIFDAREAAVWQPEEPGPRWAGPGLWIAGAVIDGVPPSTNEALILRNEHDAEELLHSLFKVGKVGEVGEEGIDFVSVQARAPEPAWRKLIELAHASQRQVWGPLPQEVTLETAIAAQLDGMLFLDRLLPEGAAWDTVEIEAFDPVIEKLSKSGLRVLPLLMGNARLLTDPGDDAEVLKWLGPQYAGQWTRELELRRTILTEEFQARGEHVRALQGQLVARLMAAGVALVVGSGAPHPWLPPGIGLHEELAEWKRAGIADETLLRLVTAGAADSFAIPERGRIAVGNVADILCVDGDPSLDVARLREPRVMVLRGHVFDAAALREMREKLARDQTAAREAAAQPIEVELPTLPEGAVLLVGHAETSSLGVRSAAERWGVVRTGEDQLAFVGRRKIPGGIDQPPVDLELRQNLRAGKLVSFEAHLRTVKHHLELKGISVAGMMRVERRADGVFIDLNSTNESIVGVDVGSVSTMVLLAHVRAGGRRFSMLRLHEALELEVVPWSLELDSTAGHLFATPDGPKYATFEANGGLRLLREQEGSGTSETVSVSEIAAPGLPLSEAKRNLLAAAAEAAAPKPEQKEKEQQR
jgi:hypothetical protein